VALNHHHEIGQKIKALRQSTRLTQERFAQRVGITTRHLVRLENGENRPRAALAQRIEDVAAEITGKPVERILPDQDDEEDSMLTDLVKQLIHTLDRRYQPAISVAERVNDYLEASRR
jgi:transcriptional regulator with XRE-family HTH domain